MLLRPVSAGARASLSRPRRGYQRTVRSHYASVADLLYEIVHSGTLLHGSPGRSPSDSLEGGEPSTIEGAPAVPFKANADRRHRIPRQRHRVTNWAAYDAGLRARGSLTV